MIIRPTALAILCVILMVWMATTVMLVYCGQAWHFEVLNDLALVLIGPIIIHALLFPPKS